MKVCFVVNPRSGAEQGTALVQALRDFSDNLSCDSSVIVLDKFTNAASEVSKSKYDVVLVAGGDGTIQNLLPVLLESGSVLGILPLGTGNDLAKELGHYRRLTSRNISSAAEELLRGRAIEISIWRYVGERFNGLFSNYISFGLDGVVTREFETLRSKGRASRFGLGRIKNRLLYMRAGLKAFGYKIPENVFATASERSFECSGAKTVVFTNLRSYTGLGWITSNSEPTDNLLEFVVMNSVLDYLKLFPRKLFRLGIKNGASAEAWTVDFGSHQAPFQVDGEYRGKASGCVKISSAGSIRVFKLKEEARGTHFYHA